MQGGINNVLAAKGFKGQVSGISNTEPDFFGEALREIGRGGINSKPLCFWFQRVN